MEKTILDNFNNKKIVVTGGTGLIGRQVVNILLQTSASLIRVVSLDGLNLDERVEYIVGDLTEYSFCKEITNGIDFVFHIAGIGASVQAAGSKVASHFVPMLMMNTNLLEACRVNSVEKIVYTSSVGAYAPAEIFRESEYRLDSIPMDFAGWAKRMAEEQIGAYQKEYGLNNFAVVRPSNVYGPGDNFDPANSLVIPSLMYRIHTGENPLMVWGDGSAIRDFAYSGDVAEGIVLALYHGTDSKFVNLGSGKAVSIKELVETMSKFIKFDYGFDTSKVTGASKRIMDISMAQKKLGYNPTTSLREGLEKTWNWFINNPNEFKKKKNYFN